MANRNPGNLDKLNGNRGIAGPGRKLGSKNKLTAARVEEEIRRIALMDPRELFEGVHGNRRTFTLREIKAMPDEIAACISSVKVRTENLTAGDDKQDTTIEIKLWDKMKALELCAKHFGWATDRLAITIDVTDRVARLEAARRRVDTLDTPVVEGEVAGYLTAKKESDE
jgi:hypothetical protein